MTAVHGVSANIIDDLTYRADQLLTHSRYGNGLTEDRIYDQQGRLLSQSLVTVDERQYFYDLNSNITQYDIDNQTYQYVYDEVDRIIKDIAANLPTIDFTYDLNGNRLSSAQNATTSTYNYTDKSNQLSNIDNAAIGHDAAGNRNSDRNGTRSFTYKDSNRLFQVIENALTVVTYTYNAQGLRTRKVTPEGTTLYHYDTSGQLISETDATGTVLKQYIYFGSMPLAQLDVAGNSDNVVYIHTDHLGTPRRATDKDGIKIWSWNSDGFATTAANDDPDGDSQKTIVNMRFPGQYYDAETGLHYNYFRYYDPATGRYITSDPIGLQGGLNTYGYVGGNPVNYVDPDGLLAQGLAGRGIIAALDKALLHTIGITSTTLLLDAIMSDYDPNDTGDSNVIPFPGTKTKTCPAPNQEPNDPCERTRKALENVYTQLVAGFLSAKNNEVMRQLWRKRAALFENSVDEYNSTCPNRWPDYKRFNLRPGGDPFNLY